MSPHNFTLMDFYGTPLRHVCQPHTFGIALRTSSFSNGQSPPIFSANVAVRGASVTRLRAHRAHTFSLTGGCVQLACDYSHRVFQGLLQESEYLQCVCSYMYMVLGEIKLSISTPPISSSFKHRGRSQLPHLPHLHQQQSTKEVSSLLYQADRRINIFSLSSSCFVVCGRASQRMPLFRRISRASGLSPHISNSSSFTYEACFFLTCYLP